MTSQPGRNRNQIYYYSDISFLSKRDTVSLYVISEHRSMMPVMEGRISEKMIGMLMETSKAYGSC